jgi:CheY-like chemotaxis protein
MKPNILILDDEADLAEGLSEYLASQGYSVSFEVNPLRALERIQEEHFLILVTDLRMPEMDGLDVVRKVKKDNGFVQIIVVTGHVSKATILNAFRLGVNNCFMKPLSDLGVLKKEIDVAVAKLNRIEELLRSVGADSEEIIPGGQK